jgi:D-serine deaminase-like pyridoxal phosphate-dependent protein
MMPNPSQTPSQDPPARTETGNRVATLDSIPTPAVVIDAAVVRRNLDRLARYAAAHGLAVRPHTKTHKSAAIGRMQLAAGSCGLTVAKAGEAEAMLAAFPSSGRLSISSLPHVRDDVPGAEHPRKPEVFPPGKSLGGLFPRPTNAADILLAYPSVDRPRAERIAAVARESRVRVAVDSSLGVRALDEAAARHGTTLGVLVDLDVGMGRTGVADAAAAVALAAEVSRARSLALEGLICYPGHVWDPPERQRAPLAAVAARLEEALDAFDRAGLCRETVSGGSTPTAYRSHLVPQLTEIRPGTYVFNDLNTLRGGFCEPADCAATILCTVVSDAVPGQVILDGGTKTFTSDLCGPAPASGHGHVVGHPEAVIHKLTEEHAQVRIAGLSAPPRLGERVAVIPNHICPCINLQNAIWWREEDGSLEPLAVDARGRLS